MTRAWCVKSLLDSHNHLFYNHNSNLQMISDMTAGAYFKSTDGHTSQWSFNLRRANIHLLPSIISHGGIILVDSTRRGKRHPDALSRTVPIWCAVINRAIGLDGEPAGLFTPPDAVSPSEHSQMDDKIQGWAEELIVSFYLLALREVLGLTYLHVGIRIYFTHSYKTSPSILDKPRFIKSTSPFCR